MFANGELEKAKELYLESIGVEADCVEAIYNLGIVSKKLGVLGESLQAFEKLHTIVPSSPEGTIFSWCLFFFSLSCDFFFLLVAPNLYLTRSLVCVLTLTFIFFSFLSWQLFHFLTFFI